jgi:hypothetical protein
MRNKDGTLRINGHVTVQARRDGLLVNFDDLPGQAVRLSWVPILTTARAALVDEPLVSLTPEGVAAAVGGAA